MRVWVQKSASMQKRTSPLKFGDLAEKSGLNSVSNLSTKAMTAEFPSELINKANQRRMSLDLIAQGEEVLKTEDVKLFLAVKESVAKTQALVKAGAEALAIAQSESQRQG